MKHRIENLDDFINESKLLDHTEYELKKAGLFDKDSDYDGGIAKAVMELMKTFTSQGHSGFSAPFVVELFSKCAAWNVLTPITSDSSEWNDVTKLNDGEPMWQNKRNPAYFSEDAGKTWWNVDEKLAKKIKESFNYITETDEAPFPVTVNDVDQPNVFVRMKDWLASQGIFSKDLTKDHVKKVFNMKSDSEYDIAADKLKYLLNKDETEN
jgi:hypothetical protein